MSVPLVDCSNAPVRDCVARLQILDCDSLGSLRAPQAEIQGWLSIVGLRNATTLALVLSADERGELAVADHDPRFAAALRAHRVAVVREMSHVIVQTPRLVAVQERFLQTKAVARLLERQPKWRDRAVVAATALEYGLPIIGGSRFYMELAQVKALPSGVYDIRKGSWIVPPAS